MSGLFRMHPALWQLMQVRAAGRVQTMLQSLVQPRRLVVTILGVGLALIWLSNAILSILFRESYPVETFRNATTLMFTFYATWHLVRASWQRPESAIEWTDVERNHLMVLPFTLRQLTMYRLATVMSATVLKATIGGLLLLPDLSYPVLGWIGLWLGLTFVELIRLAVDSWTSGMRPKTYLAFRLAVVTTCVLAALLAMSIAVSRVFADGLDHTIPPVFLFFQALRDVCFEFPHTEIGELICAPFMVFVNLLSTTELTWVTGLWGALAVSMTAIMLHLVPALVLWSESWNRKNVKLIPQESRPRLMRRTRLNRDPSINWFPDALFWRQVMGAKQHATGVLMALIPPACLSAMPLFMKRLTNEVAFVNLVAGLAFYTFLLLPAALKFDFRRDYDRLFLLKMLPLSPFRIVLGQLATPVVITTMFQYAMLAFGYMMRPVEPWILLAAVVAFPPMNVVIYGWENLLFLIYPQRLKQEGIEVFLRTTVMFTAKGLAFAFLFAIVLVWVSTSSSIEHWTGINRRIVFGAGLWFVTAIIGAILIKLASRQFRSMEASLSH